MDFNDCFYNSLLQRTMTTRDCRNITSEVCLNTSSTMVLKDTHDAPLDVKTDVKGNSKRQRPLKT